MSFSPTSNTNHQESLFSHSFGYHDFEGNFAPISNITKIIGYIPIIGTIVGIARIVFANKIAQSDNISHDGSLFIVGQSFRGFIETLSLGLLLIIPDIIVTINRSAAEKAKFNDL